MVIHVVQPGDTIQSIADYYGISVARLMLDNGIDIDAILVPGQAIVIAKPAIVHVVEEGDTLLTIANAYNVTVILLLINNPFLSGREYIYPGDVIVIKYDTMGKITLHGNTIPFIDPNILRKTLPYLTYLSVLNYTAASDGEIVSYYDDTDIIRIAKEYGTVPLMLLTTLTIEGDANIRVAYDLFLNESYQNKQIENILLILKSKGYSGINISCEYLNATTYRYYAGYLSKLTASIREAGYQVFITINPNITNIYDEVIFDKLDYSIFNEFAQNIIFMNYEWATSVNPPSPISSTRNITAYIEYITKFIPANNIIIGVAVIGYDWELPYSSGLTSVYSLSIDRAINLAGVVGATIQFDEVSQTPYFRYSIYNHGNPVEHIVWFVDARTINSLLQLIVTAGLHGLGIWNITIFHPSLWITIYSQFEIEKLLL